MMATTQIYEDAAAVIENSRRTIAFTGAGISVESGIPPFRGKDGLWGKYDPATFEIGYFQQYPGHAWEVMRDIFYELFGQVKPNTAHYVLAEMEAAGLLHGVITQNVDSLHHDAGSRTIHEFHGSLRKLVCLQCGAMVRAKQVDLSILPPLCSKCQGLLKPDAVFFGESIPGHAHRAAFGEAGRADVFIVVGTTGEVAPANMIPRLARQNGARIIEVNTEPSEYTDTVTHIFLQGPATAVLEQLMDTLQDRRGKKWASPPVYRDTVSKETTDHR